MVWECLLYDLKYDKNAIVDYIYFMIIENLKDFLFNAFFKGFFKDYSKSKTMYLAVSSILKAWNMLYMYFTLTE